MMSADVTLAERLYSILLRAYPPHVRARFATGMAYAFGRELHAARLRGHRALLGCWVTTIVTTVWFGVSARLEPVPQHNSAATSGDPTMRHLFTIDWRDAWRSLRATPVVTAIAVLSLALGIGANTALFSILNSMILKSLPVRDPQQLVVVDGVWTNPIWEQVRAHEGDVSAGAFAWADDSFDLSQGGPVDLVEGLWASGSMFDVLGVTTMLGRPFTREDDVRGGGRDGAVAVISHGFWQRRFGGAADVIGRTVAIRRVAFTIIGVTPPGFFGPDVGRAFDITVPLGTEPLLRRGESWLDRRSTWWLSIMARVQPSQSIDQATARLRAVQPQIRLATIPVQWNAKDQAEYLSEALRFVPAAGRSWLRSRYERPLTAILAVVGVVLLIACANIANLLLARALARRHELGVRLALGASWLRLARQLAAESFLLAAAGGALGLLFAQWSSSVLVAQLATGGNHPYLDLSLDWRVLAFTFAVAAITALVFSVAPILGLSGVSPNEAIVEQTRSVASDRRTNVRNVLVVAQMALSLTLVVAAGLFARTFFALATRDVGFDRDAILSVDIDVQQSGVAPEARLELFERLRESVAAVPGVASAALTAVSPLSGSGWNTKIEDPAVPGLTPRQQMSWVNAVTPGWFETYGVRLSSGRSIANGDSPGAPRVAVVDRAFASRFFNGANPVGRQFTTRETRSVTVYRIVGLVEDTLYNSMRAEASPTIYLPLAQGEQVGPGMTIGVRAVNGDSSTLVRSLSEAIGRVDPRAGLRFISMSDQVGALLTQERLVARLSMFFGGLALLLAGLGLYGVTSYAVSRRRVEIGIRMALGAHPASIVRLVLARVAWLVALGVAAGAGLSLWASRYVRALLYDLEPRDPVTFIAAAIVLGLIGLLAGWLPARRAARIDPTVVLREG